MGVMRHIFYYSLFLILSSVSGGGFAYAQPTSEVKATDYRQSYLANPYYNQMATEALEHKPPRFDFMKFRSYYSQTRQYDPMGTRILKDLDELAFIVMNDDDPVYERDEYQTSYPSSIVGRSNKVHPGYSNTNSR